MLIKEFFFQICKANTKNRQNTALKPKFNVEKSILLRA